MFIMQIVDHQHCALVSLVRIKVTTYARSFQADLFSVSPVALKGDYFQIRGVLWLRSLPFVGLWGTIERSKINSTLNEVIIGFFETYQAEDG